MLLSIFCSRRLFALPLASPSGPKRSITAITLFLFTVLGATASHATSTWTTLDHPSATVTATYLRGIDGTNIVGWYKDSSGTHATLYDGSTWATLDYPSETTTTFSGIDGNNMVGSYTDSSGNRRGTLYDGSTWTTLDPPGATGTFLRGIDGTNIVGWYVDSSGNRRGTLYDGLTWATLDYPSATTYRLTWYRRHQHSWVVRG